MFGRTNPLIYPVSPHLCMTFRERLLHTAICCRNTHVHTLTDGQYTTEGLCTLSTQTMFPSICRKEIDLQVAPLPRQCYFRSRLVNDHVRFVALRDALYYYKPSCGATRSLRYNHHLHRTAGKSVWMFVRR